MPSREDGGSPAGNAHGIEAPPAAISVPHARGHQYQALRAARPAPALTAAARDAQAFERAGAEGLAPPNRRIAKRRT
jgi:hypothetical protein